MLHVCSSSNKALQAGTTSAFVCPIAFCGGHALLRSTEVRMNAVAFSYSSNRMMQRQNVKHGKGLKPPPGPPAVRSFPDLCHVIGPACKRVRGASLQQSQRLRSVLPPDLPTRRAVPLVHLPRGCSRKVTVGGVSHPLQQSFGRVELQPCVARLPRKLQLPEFVRSPRSRCSAACL